MTTEKIPFPESAWPRLKAALEMIAAEPARLYMRDWAIPNIKRDGYESEILAIHGEVPPCGTAACLAGWIGITYKMDVQGKDLKIAAREIDSLGAPAAYALRAMGLRSQRSSRIPHEWSENPEPVAWAFEDPGHGIFYMTGVIREYADLRRELMARFTFPEDLPEAEVAVG